MQTRVLQLISSSALKPTVPMSPTAQIEDEGFTDFALTVLGDFWGHGDFVITVEELEKGSSKKSRGPALTAKEFRV